MKRLSILFGCVIVLFAFSGCQQLGRNEKNAVGVIIEGGGKFPDFLVGRWKAVPEEDIAWEVAFEPNGVISSAVIPLGSVEVRPNQITRVQGRKGEPGIFEAGDFEVYFDPQYRELSVYIKIKRVYVDMGSIAEGPCEYFIAGNISEDGKTWQADAFTSFDLLVLTPDPNHREDRSKFEEIGRLDTDFSKDQESLTFTKVPDGNTASNK